MDNHIYTSVDQLRAEIENAGTDPHLKAAAVLFEHDPDEVTKPERSWAKALNMAACLGLSPEAVADFTQAPLDKVREMLDKYHQLVLA